MYRSLAAGRRLPRITALRWKSDDANANPLKEVVSSQTNINRQPLAAKDEEGRLSSMYKKFTAGIPKSTLLTAGFMLEHQCATGPDFNRFMSRFGLPDTFHAWFLVTELHVWMISTRIMAQEMPAEEGLEVRNALVNALWKDCEERVKMLGDISASRRRKYMTTIGQEFQASLFVYDRGILGNDMELANAVYRRFYSACENPNIEHIEAVVRYVRRTMATLDRMDISELILKGGVLKWLPLDDE